jgi:hypothetical protein
LEVRCFFYKSFYYSSSSPTCPSCPAYFIGGVLHGRVDEDIEAGRDQDRSRKAEEKQQDQVVHQERLRSYPVISE